MVFQLLTKINGKFNIIFNSRLSIVVLFNRKDFMKKEEELFLAIERTKDMYDKKKAKVRRYTILILGALMYFFWFWNDFNKTLDYFTGILEALIMGGLLYLLAIIILSPTLAISEREEEEINRLKKDFERLERENLDV